MNILLLCNSLSIGGIETYILRFSRWMKQEHPEHVLHLICKSGEFGPYQNDFEEIGVLLYSIPMGFFKPSEYLNFYRFLKLRHFDVVCDFGGNFAAFPLITAFSAGINRRLVFYTNARIPYSRTISRQLYQYISNYIVRIFSTNILSNSLESFNYYFCNYTFFDDPRFQVIRNGIPLNEPITTNDKISLRQDIGILPNQKMVLHVGSARWEKNHALMLKMAQAAQEYSGQVCFCFVGPKVEEHYHETVKLLRLKNVRFLGERRDVYRLLQVSDVFLFPSLSEGQPNAFIEAIMSGIPFIASDINSIKETLPSFWNNRWLFSPKNVDDGTTLLREHLNNDFRHENEFKALVDWCRMTYDQDLRFAEFFRCLIGLKKSKNL